VVSGIHILNSSIIADERLQELSRNVGSVFRLPSYLTQGQLNLDVAFDSSRQQHNSTALLIQLVNSSSGSEEKKIAIVSVDLYIPILTFVFGEAQLEGVAAVVSTHRLSNQFYGLQRNDELTISRLEKEVIHELGHTFGLYHCHQFECVMRSSTYVEEIDLKRNSFCEACAGRMAKAR
jgi:archaemetzincin